jgi:uncharacterized protein (TIGR03435 family)
MRWILQVAYGLSSLQIAGPAWLDSDRFDLLATAPAGVPDTAIKPLLQALLKDRFQLTAHLDAKEMPVYNLVVAKDGLKVKQIDPNGPFPQSPPRMPGASSMMIGNKTMAELAEGLAGAAGRPVFDKTGIEGRYFCAVQYSQIGNDAGQAPDIFGALQQQLGLRLEPARSVVETLVVDHMERTPTEN